MAVTEPAVPPTPPAAEVVAPPVVAPAVVEPVVVAPVEPTPPVIDATPPEPPIPPEPPVERVVPALEGYRLPEGAPQAVAQFAHDNDMTQAQLDATIQQYSAMTAAGDNASKAKMEVDGATLVASWGAAKTENLSVVRRALAQNDPDKKLSKLLNETGYGNHPAILGFFLSVGNSMKEGGFLKGAVNTPPGKKSAAQTMFGDNHPTSQT